MEISVEHIVDEIRANRLEFADFFLLAQRILPIEKRQTFQSVTVTAVNDRSSFEMAILYAIEQEFVNALIQLVIDARLDGNRLAEYLIAGKHPDAGSALQSLVNEASGFSHPDIFWRGIVRSMRWTGKVIIDGEAKGTGILIGPDQFLTSWHVTRSLFDPQTGKPLTHINMEVIFDNYVNYRNGRPSTNPPVIVAADPQWHILHSRCHELELRDQFPNPLVKLKSFWDYTIIKLKKPLGDERKWAVLSDLALVPAEQAKIMMVQHPGGQSLRIDMAEIRDINPKDPAIPSMRFLHALNAEGGSSGAPCFDKEFSLIGIHQGVWEQKVLNRGIPIHNIIEHIKSCIGSLPQPVPGVKKMWYLGSDYEPVIGLDSFQDLILTKLVPGLFTLLNLSGNRGSGKTFTSEVVFSMLPESEHLKLTLRANEIGTMDATIFANHLLCLAGCEKLTFPQLSESSAISWIKHDILGPMMAVLDSKRLNRTVWVRITELNRYEIAGEHLSDCLNALYEELIDVRYPWLRLVLDGSRAPLPPTISLIVQQVLMKPITLDDVIHYLTKILNELEVDANPRLMAVPFINYYEQMQYYAPEKALTLLNQCIVKSLAQCLSTRVKNF